MKTFKSYFATTAGAAGFCNLPETGGESSTKEHHPTQKEGSTAHVKEWKPHPKSTAKPDFSSWPALRTGTSG
ncbi:hypothetical protein EOI86_17330 [Hwanghaeella grinnelliae]|uniref:Uncharacterized protein n=1 Tax=Hwanghaeella grinnelliae TaxID=2500179 RepID=A0A3S2VKY1_9PROT|nr:hypothetical protein [Hwanghaeella grinnelliae]RVU34620.1 hypothetical protein EOI86_17330 [Hwanghaeella grinnelliae]